MAGFKHKLGWFLGLSVLVGTVQTAQAAGGTKSAEAAQVQYQHGESFLRMGSSRAAIRPLEQAINLYRQAGNAVGEHNSLVDLTPIPQVRFENQVI